MTPRIAESRELVGLAVAELCDGLRAAHEGRWAAARDWFALAADSVTEAQHSLDGSRPCEGGCGDQGYDNWDLGPPGFWCCDCLPEPERVPQEWYIDD